LIKQFIHDCLTRVINTAYSNELKSIFAMRLCVRLSVLLMHRSCVNLY